MSDLTVLKLLDQDELGQRLQIWGPKDYCKLKRIWKWVINMEYSTTTIFAKTWHALTAWLLIATCTLTKTSERLSRRSTVNFSTDLFMPSPRWLQHCIETTILLKTTKRQAFLAIFSNVLTRWCLIGEFWTDNARKKVYHNYFIFFNFLILTNFFLKSRFKKNLKWF